MERRVGSWVGGKGKGEGEGEGGDCSGDDGEGREEELDETCGGESCWRISSSPEACWLF